METINHFFVFAIAFQQTKGFSRRADKLEAFEILAEKNDIESGIEVEEEVEGCDDYEEI